MISQTTKMLFHIGIIEVILLKLNSGCATSVVEVD